MTLEEALGGEERNVAGLVWSAATAFALLQYGQGVRDFSEVLHNGRNFWKPGRWLVPGKRSKPLGEEVRRALAGKDAEGALRALSLAAAKEPARADYLVLRALIRIGLEMPDVFSGFDKFLSSSLSAQQDLERALSLEPDSVWAHLVFGVLEYMRRRFHAAEPHFTRVVALRPRWAWGRILRADVIYYLRQVDEAKAEFARATDLDPKNSWAWALLGRAKNLTREPSMQQDLDRSVALEPRTAWLYAWRGIAKLAITRDPTALKDFEKAKTLDHDYDRIYAWRASALIKEGRPREAIADLKKALALNPLIDISHYSMGRAYFMTGQDAKGVEQIRQAVKGSHMSIWIYNWGDWNHQNHARRETMQDLDKVVAVAPRAAWAWSWRGQTKLALMDFPGALADLDRGIGLDPKFAYAYAWRAEAKRRLGDPKGAGRDLARALALDPKCVWAWAWRGRLHLDAGRLKEAERDLSKAISLNRRIALAYVWRFEARRKLGRHRDALSDVAAAIEFYPTWKWLWVWKARLLEAAGRRAQAMPCLDEAVKLAPRGETYLLRLRLRLLAGDRAGAKKDLESALAQDPHSALLKDVVKRGPLLKPFLSRGGWDLAADFAALEPNSPSDEAAWVQYDAFARGSRDLRAGVRLMREARLDDAVAALDRAIEADPNDYGALVVKADALLKVEPPRPAEAEALATRCVELRPESREAKLLRHQIRRSRGDWNGALQDLRAARSEQDLRVTLEAARLLLRLDRLDEAEREVDGVLELDPFDQGANRLRADALMRAGRFGEAERVLRGLLELMPGLSWPRVSIARALYFSGRRREAAAEIARACKGAAGRGYSAWLWRAIIAGRGLSRALALNPRCATALMARAQENGSLEELRMAQRLDPFFAGAELFIPRGTAEVPAWALAWRGGLSGSESDLREALRRAPRLFWAWAWLGHGLLRAGAGEEAISCLDRALTLQPAYHEALIWRGQAHLEAGRDEAAARDFGAALGFDQDLPAAWFGRAAARGRLGDLAGQREDMLRGSRLAPELVQG